MTGLVLVLCVLAAYRLTRLVARDDITEPVRELWWRLFDRDSKPGELIDCVFCAGWWVTVLVVWAAAALGFVDWRWRSMVFVPVVAGGQALLSAIDERLSW